MRRKLFCVVPEWHPVNSYLYPYASDDFQRARSFLYNLRCTDDNATDLSSCEYDHFEVEDCDDNFAIVKCYDLPPSSEWRFRLSNQGVIGGTAGILEVRPAEGLPWGSVAYTGGFRDLGPVGRQQEQAFVSRGAYNFNQYYGLPASICRRMGFADAAAAVATSVILPSDALTGPVWFPSLTCDQSHYDINSCHDGKFGSAVSFTFYTDVSIDCYPPLMMHLPSWELRAEHVAAPGRDLYRVLARENASMPWGTVGYGWDPYPSNSLPPWYYRVAEAICRLAGLNIDGRAVALDYSRAFVGNSSLGVVGLITRCHPYAPLSLLSDCVWNRTSYRQSGSSHANDLIADCDYRPQPPRDKWQYRLENSAVNGSGAFRISPAPGVWNLTVCDFASKSPEAMSAMCSSVGFGDFAQRAAAAHSRLLTSPLPRFGSVVSGASNAASVATVMLCRGWPGETIADSHIQYSSARSCSPTRALVCVGPPLNYSLFEYRLVTDGFDNNYTGRVEFRPNGASPWGALPLGYDAKEFSPLTSQKRRVCCRKLLRPAASPSSPAPH